jgi:lipoyl(octanoyl) transferase
MCSAPHTFRFASGPIEAYDLGIAPYLPVQELQRRLRTRVATGACAGYLLLLEHPPVITLGYHASLADVLSPANASSRGVEVARSERGGGCTLHAPGQLVSYPVMPIPRRDLRDYVRKLEEALLIVLARREIAAARMHGRPGLYLDELKIASLGLRCEHGVASHGSALNIDVDLTLFDLITSCGDVSLRQTSMREATGRLYSVQEIKQEYLGAFRQVFQVEVSPLRSMPTAGFEPAAPGSGGQCSIP